tara:strand:+ start:2967 stop:4115 length:1149 start_codon:yes stop_codon:yes gene_type:complete
MIHVNKIGEMISGSYGNTPFSRNYEKDIYLQMIKLANQADETDLVEEYNNILEEFKLLVTQDYTIKFIDINFLGGVSLWKDPAGRHFLKFKEGEIINVPLPESLVNRFYDSHDNGTDVVPLYKLWMRWLRNSILRKKKTENFTKRFFDFIDMKYVHPTLKTELLEEHGLSEELAEERATMYQVKITKEGLVNCFKVSREIMHKYDKETGEEVPRYERTFNVDTGEIEGEGLPDTVEERLFEPSMMGTGGDAFYCEGANGYDSPQHFIKVGCTHRLSSWDQVNTNDDQSCVAGLHVGGLKYIAWYSGEIHNVFVDPMHVGAVPDSEDGAIRCLQYFVHSSLVGVNGSMYHSSAYAAKTDAEWEAMKQELLESSQEVVQDLKSL